MPGPGSTNTLIVVVVVVLVVTLGALIFFWWRSMYGVWSMKHTDRAKASTRADGLDAASIVVLSSGSHHDSERKHDRDGDGGGGGGGD
ncbi:MAG: hypothetical protein ACKVS8_04695 [Phycisphaerales bacterium]